MPLTPADIHNMDFRKSSLGKRGYDQDEVDVLLDSVSHEMIGLLEENDFLRDQVRRAEAAVARPAGAGNNGAAEAELAAVNSELDRVRRAYDEAARNARALRDMLVEARGAAAGPAPAGPALAEVAEAGVDRVLAVAHRTADQHVQGAHQEATGLVRDARAESERITEDARQAARDLAEQSRRRHSDAVAETQNKRTAARKEITELTDLAAQYRAALEDHIRRQTQG